MSIDMSTLPPNLSRIMDSALRRSLTILPDPETVCLRAALNEIRDILGQRQDRPWTTLSQIDQIARKALV